MKVFPTEIILNCAQSAHHNCQLSIVNCQFPSGVSPMNNHLCEKPALGFPKAGLLSCVLCIVQVGIDAAFGEKLLMGAAFCNHTIGNGNDPAGRANGG